MGLFILFFVVLGLLIGIILNTSALFSKSGGFAYAVAGSLFVMGPLLFLMMLFLGKPGGFDDQPEAVWQIYYVIVFFLLFYVANFIFVPLVQKRDPGKYYRIVYGISFFLILSAGLLGLSFSSVRYILLGSSEVVSEDSILGKYMALKRLGERKIPFEKIGKIDFEVSRMIGIEVRGMVGFELKKNGEAVVTTERRVEFEEPPYRRPMQEKTVQGTWKLKSPYLILSYDRYQDRFFHFRDCKKQKPSMEPCFRYDKNESKLTSPLEVPDENIFYLDH